MAFRIGCAFVFFMICINQIKVDGLRNEFIGDFLYNAETSSITFICFDHIYPVRYFEHSVQFKCSNYSKDLPYSGRGIHFQNCQMSRIKYNITETFFNLHTFNASSIELQYLPKSTFDGSKELRTFLASNNRLKRISESQFEYAKQLRHADFSYNQINHIDENAFMGAEKLEILNMSHNRMSELLLNTFAPLIQLKTLDMSFNEFVRIQNQVYVKLLSLEHLFLEFNNLTKIEPQALDHMDVLEVLHLNNNHLMDLDNLKGSNFPSLHSLVIVDNNFNCSYLRNFFQIPDHEHFLKALNETKSSDDSENSVHGVGCIDNPEPIAIEKTTSIRTTISSKTKLEIVADDNYIPNESVHSVDKKDHDKIDHHLTNKLLICLCVLAIICIILIIGVFSWQVKVIRREINNMNYKCTYYKYGIEEAASIKINSYEKGSCASEFDFNIF